MRSKIAQRILNETPQEVKESVRNYADEVVRRDEEIMLIARNMTPEEHQKAIWDYARTKWHRLRNETPDYKAPKESLKKVGK